jgi:hypothetical protein
MIGKDELVLDVVVATLQARSLRYAGVVTEHKRVQPPL